MLPRTGAAGFYAPQVTSPPTVAMLLYAVATLAPSVIPAVSQSASAVSATLAGLCKEPVTHRIGAELCFVKFVVPLLMVKLVTVGVTEFSALTFADPRLNTASRAGPASHYRP